MVGNYLLNMYATNDVISNAYVAMRNYTLQPNQEAVNYANVLCKKALRIRTVYNEGHLKRLFIEGVIPELRLTVPK